MTAFNENDPFFTHAPVKAKVLTLDGFLHDATVLSIEIDRRSGDCKLNCSIFYISEHWGLPPNTVYTFTLKSCTRAVVTRDKWKPKVKRRFEGHGNEDERRREWYGLNRTESLSWSVFAKRVKKEGDGDIYSADLLHSPEGQSLRIWMSLDSRTEWYYVELSGVTLICSRSDGWVGSVEEIGAVANAYWDAFKKRSQGRF